MGTPILGMCKTKTYKEIENLIATIYSNDISDFGNKYVTENWTDPNYNLRYIHLTPSSIE